jgi:hypothetical protein
MDEGERKGVDRCGWNICDARLEDLCLLGSVELWDEGVDPRLDCSGED